MKTYLMTWKESEIAGVKKFNCDLNIGETNDEAIRNQLKKNSKKGTTSYDMNAIEITTVSSVFLRYGFILTEPVTDEAVEIKPILNKHEKNKEVEEDERNK